MIKLDNSDSHTLSLTCSPYDIIRLQTVVAYAMTGLELTLRDDPMTPARRNFWQSELNKVEADWGRLQRILDEYNERL